jgi:hypothetical protein
VGRESSGVPQKRTRVIVAGRIYDPYDVRGLPLPLPSSVANGVLLLESSRSSEASVGPLRRHGRFWTGSSQEECYSAWVELPRIKGAPSDRSLRGPRSAARARKPTAAGACVHRVTRPRPAAPHGSELGAASIGR